MFTRTLIVALVASCVAPALATFPHFNARFGPLEPSNLNRPPPIEARGDWLAARFGPLEPSNLNLPPPIEARFGPLVPSNLNRPPPVDAYGLRRRQDYSEGPDWGHVFTMPPSGSPENQDEGSNLDQGSSWTTGMSQSNEWSSRSIRARRAAEEAAYLARDLAAADLE